MLDENIADSSLARTRREKDAAIQDHVARREAKQDSVSTLGVLGAALKEKRVLDGVISGVVTDNKCAYWIMLYEQNIIKIPFTESYMKLPQELIPGKRPSLVLRQNQLLTKSIGMTTPFILISFEIDTDGNYVWLASRIQALARVRNIYFGTNAPRKARVGMDVMGQIISHDEFTAYVSVCGVDVRVPNFELSHRFIPDVSREFAVGSNIKLRIMDIKENGNDIPELRVSAKPIEAQEWVPNLKLLKAMGNKPRLRGIVTTVKEEKASGNNAPGMTINLWLEGIKVGAFSKSSRLQLDNRITTGSVVEFEVNGISRNNYVYGEILFIVKSAQPL